MIVNEIKNNTNRITFLQITINNKQKKDVII